MDGWNNYSSQLLAANGLLTLHLVIVGTIVQISLGLGMDHTLMISVLL